MKIKITVEGPDGAATDTLARELADYLDRMDIKVRPKYQRPERGALDKLADTTPDMIVEFRTCDSNPEDLPSEELHESEADQRPDDPASLPTGD